jgi:CDP-diglyceride synthetase
MMDILLITGAILAVLIGTAHSYLGEQYILARLFRRSDLPQLFGSDTFTKQTLRFAWHLTTIAWIGLASVVLIGVVVPSSEQLSAILKAISITFFISSVVTLATSRGRHFAWIVFLSISVLVWIGS